FAILVNESARGESRNAARGHGTSAVASSSERIYRSLRGLEKTASTSRVLNLAGLAGRPAPKPDPARAPVFPSPVLNCALILKHRLRPEEAELFAARPKTATKLILPFDRADLSLGGRAVFVGERGWMPSLTELRGGSDDLMRDVEVLEALNELP